MDSEVIGYKFFGQTEFSQESTITGISMYGDRYDYVLTRYNKAKADELTNNKERYFIHNDIEATVSPIDQVDEDSKATSSYDWFYEAPKYFGGDGDFWAEKYGVYGEYTRVESSEDISNYALGEFESGEIDSLSYLKYRAICDGAPYAYQKERTYYLDGNKIATNRKPRFEQKGNALSDWYKEQIEAYGQHEAGKMRSRLTVKKSKRSYNTAKRLMPGCIFYYDGQRHVMTGQSSYGRYLRAYNCGTKDFHASKCQIIRFNTGLVFV